MDSRAPHSDDDEQSAALFALGLLEGTERDAFEEHLAHCARCQWLVEQDRGVLSNLDAAAAEREPSPALKSQILAHLVPVLADSDRGPAPAQPGRDLQFIRRASLALPLAVVVALVLALGYLLGRQAALDQELISVPLQGDTGGGSASVTVRRSGATEIALRGLPDPPPGHVYQAWVVDGDGVRLAAAAYDDGNGTFPLSRSALGKGVEVTIETEPGADTPTTQPLLWGRASP